MSLHSSTEHENTDLRHAGMDSRHPRLQGRVRNIHVNLDSSTPCWNDAIERFCFKPIEALPPRIFKGGREGHEDQITDMATNQKNVFFLRATITQILRSSRKFCFDLECSNTEIDSRQDAKYAKFRNRKIDNFYKPSYSFFPTFAALASLREIFRVSVAALPRWALRVLRGDIQFRLGAALPRCASAVSTPEKAIRIFKEGDL